MHAQPESLVASLPWQWDDYRIIAGWRHVNRASHLTDRLAIPGSHGASRWKGIR
jgi:hypothetical protein